MERRGSGIRKILEATAGLYGYTADKAPHFFVNKQNDFFLTIPNVNYPENLVTPHVTPHDTIHDKTERLLLFCEAPRSREEMMIHVGVNDRSYFQKQYLRPLLDGGKIEMTIPDKPRSKHQKYRTK